MIDLKKYEIWITDMNPAKGAEPGKIRPVVIVQSNLLNNLGHFSTIVCPVSSQKRDINKLRISVEASSANGLRRPSSILLDQITAIDLSRLKEKIGVLEKKYHSGIKETLTLILDIEA